MNTASNPPLTARRIALRDFDEQLVAAWGDLEDRAIDGNAFLSPAFVLPAAHHLTPKADPIAVIVEETSTDSPAASKRLMGLMLLMKASDDSRPIPGSALQLYHSRHSYRSGVFLDSTRAEEAARCIATALRDGLLEVPTIGFRDWYADGPSSVILKNAFLEAGLQWFENESYQRACLDLRQERDFVSKLPNSLRKELRRCGRRLAERGTVTHTLHTGASVDSAVIDRHIQLEHMGWKGENGSSLIARGDVEFFRSAAAVFAARGKAFFSEIAVNDQVIASTSNFISGSDAFAFKVGWHPEFSQVSPGQLNELDTLQCLPEKLLEVRSIDSGAEEGSFIERLWPGRMRITEGCIALNARGRITLRGIGVARRVKRSVSAMLRKSRKSG